MKTLMTVFALAMTMTLSVLAMAPSQKAAYAAAKRPQSRMERLYPEIAAEVDADLAQLPLEQRQKFNRNWLISERVSELGGRRIQCNLFP